MDNVNALIYVLGDIAALAQLQFQARHKNIDPVIGINRQMRKQGFAVDLLLIDCHVSKKRITLLIDDAKPDTVGYQLGYNDKSPSSGFSPMPVAQLTEQGFLELMERELV
jgi:hypothetical protein